MAVDHTHDVLHEKEHENPLSLLRGTLLHMDAKLIAYADVVALDQYPLSSFSK